MSHTTTSRRWLILPLAAAALAAGSIPATAMTSGASPRSVAAGQLVSAPLVRTTAGTRPTVVLVHGAFADASGWSAEIIALQKLGYPVIAPSNPLRGLTSDADYIRSVLATIPGPVILVGHSYGGAVITNAARGASNVKALVYVGAFVPDVGESIATSYDPTAYPGSLLGPDTTMVRPTYNPAAPAGADVDVYIKPSDFRQVFAGDESRTVAAELAASQRPLSYFAETEASGDPAWKTTPCWDLITLDDHAISPGGQKFMAQRAGATISAIHSAHDVMISHPAAVVATILKAVKAVD